MVVLGKLLGEMMRRYPRHFSLLVALLLVEGVIAAMAVLSIAPLADVVLSPDLEGASGLTLRIVDFLRIWSVEPGFLLFAGLFLAANVIKSMLEVATRIAILHIKYSVLRDMVSDCLSTFFRARWSFFVATDQGSLLNTFQRELVRVGDTLGHIATLIATALQLGIYLIVPLLLNAKMTLISLGIALLFGIPFLAVQPINYRLGKRNTETANTAMGVLQEILGAAKLVLGFARQREVVVKYMQVFDSHIRVTLRSQALISASSSLYAPAGIASVLVALSIAVRDGTPFAEVAAVLWSLLRALPMVGKLLEGKTTIDNFVPSYEQLIRLREKAAVWQQPQGRISFSRLRDEIRFEGVAFAYPGRPAALLDIDLRIQRGSMVALVGESGAGKSTVIDLLLGLITPKSGEILIDGISLADLDINSFRERVGYVPQEPFLFHATIRDNLTWANSEANEQELWEACRMANAEDFLHRLPDGMDTVVGDRGTRLSGGQRQRLALARALLRRPELLILDEATSSLDAESEQQIQQAMEDIQDTTIVSIAHRLSTVVRANYIYVFEAGRVVEDGTYEMLTSRDGRFSQMMRLQELVSA